MKRQKRMYEGLVWIGKIVQMDPIPEAEFIVSVTVVCGKGGKWRGVVRKADFTLGDKCTVYLPDSIVPKTEEFKFMESRGWRIRMCRFRGAPSEVLIMPIGIFSLFNEDVGVDVTKFMNVTKYFKPVPANLQGKVKGEFPSFIPKTDEPNYQSNWDLVERLHGYMYYITEKCDGSSTTAYRYKDKFGICSRNYELEWDADNGYCKVAWKYGLVDNLPEGIALQWETCGPKIQGNPMGLREVDGFAFSAYNIEQHRYLELGELWDLCQKLRFPMVKIEEAKLNFDSRIVHLLGEGKYANGNEREGVVVRSQKNVGSAPISFKVINLNYEK